jgi:hypothetical protein
MTTNTNAQETSTYNDGLADDFKLHSVSQRSTGVNYAYALRILRASGVSYDSALILLDEAHRAGACSTFFSRITVTYDAEAKLYTVR